jgi:hypothetical protein
MYRHDVRANTWQGTAFGVVQAVNTLGPPRAVRQGYLAPRPRPHQPGASADYAERRSGCPRGGIAAGRDLDPPPSRRRSRDTGDMRTVPILDAVGLVLEELKVKDGRYYRCIAKVTDLGAASAVEPLTQEYLAWASEELAGMLGCPVRADSADRAQTCLRSPGWNRCDS